MLRVRPCPFCGHEFATEGRFPTQPTTQWLQCLRCDARGPEVVSDYRESDALKLWNNRAEVIARRTPK